MPDENDNPTAPEAQAEVLAAALKQRRENPEPDPARSVLEKALEAKYGNAETEEGNDA
jgi:hypothetical protein